MNQVHEYIHLLYSRVLQGAPETMRSCYRKVLDTGQEFNEIDIEASHQLHAEGRCQAKQCYHNCQMALLRSSGLHYYEGWVVSIIPIEHAWLLGEDSKAVIEPTLIDPAVGLRWIREGIFWRRDSGSVCA